MGVFGGSPGGASFCTSAPRARRRDAGGAGARVRVGFGGLRGVFARCGHSGGVVALRDALALARAWGCFRDCVGAAGSSPWRRDALLAGAAVVRSGGLPPRFLGLSLSSRPVALVSRPDRSVARPRRAFRASRGLALSFAILLSGTLALALSCALPLDLDLNRLQRLRYHKEPLQLKRCRALSSAHDNHLFGN